MCPAGFSIPTGVVIMGGYDNKEFLSSVQQFSVPDRNSPATWKSLPSFDSPRAFASAAVIGNSMYVVGGGRTVSATQQLTFDSVLRCVAMLQLGGPDRRLEAGAGEGGGLGESKSATSPQCMLSFAAMDIEHQRQINQCRMISMVLCIVVHI